MRWQERIEATVPAWGAVLLAWIVLVAGWAAVAPDEKEAPGGFIFLALVVIAPAIWRTARVPWRRAVGFVAALAVAVAAAAQVGSLALWLLVVETLTVPAAYWLVDRAWSPPRRSDEPRGGG